jgi:hypothetical protein
LLLCVNLPAAHRSLDLGELEWPNAGCAGLLGSWGSARPRAVRGTAGEHVRSTPRRARCRSCGSTQVLASSATFPRHPDRASTVGAVLLAATDGLGHRRIARQVGLPPTTVRGWLRRARSNAHLIWQHTIRWPDELDLLYPFSTITEPLAAMVDAIGRAVQAWIGRQGPADDPWELVVTLSGVALLAPHGRSANLVYPLDRI